MQFDWSVIASGTEDSVICSPALVQQRCFGLELLLDREHYQEPRFEGIDGLLGAFTRDMGRRRNNPPDSLRRVLTLLTLGSVVGVVVTALVPINSTMYRLGFLASLLGSWTGTLSLLWPRKRIRIALLALPVLLVLPFLLPGRPIDSGELGASYVAELKSLEGVGYQWGGESSLGIDCSGLPRRAFRDALLAYGMRHLNGDAFRRYAKQWWFDTSARALGQGYRGFTASLDLGGTIEAMSYANLMPGDLAVTVSGKHVLVYAGDQQWIQADPFLGLVATLHGKEDENLWFGAPITMHRWSVLLGE